MQPKIFVIVVLASLGGSCFPAITIQEPQHDNLIDHLVEATTKILTSCYEERIKAVGVYGNSTGTLLGTRLSKTIPVISIGGSPSSKLVHNESAMGKNSDKLEMFTILAGSSTQLHLILGDIKRTPWWNHMASFLIINSDETRSTESGNDCSNAFEFLRVAWKMNLLNAKLLCVRKTTEVSLYSYNPYTATAPEPWKLWTTDKGTDDHPWSMFVLDYREDDDICEILDFDKTMDLGGYVIRCTVQDVDGFWQTNLNATGRASFGGPDGMAAEMWFRAMNAEATLTIHDSSELIVYLNEYGETRGPVLDLIDGTTDVNLNAYYLDDLANFTVTYPHLKGGLGIATQHSRPRSALSKINSVIDIKSRYGLYIVMLVTPVVLKFVLRKSLTLAILDTIRFICNSGLSKLPNNLAARIFLAAMFSFQITVLALYTGKLASILTKPAYHRNVDTIRDLGELGHTIYGHKSFAHMFKDPMFKDRFVGLEHYECLSYVLRDSTAACVHDWEILRAADYNSTFYMSRDMIKETSLVNAYREDWPLGDRLKELIARTFENGILPKIYLIHSKTYSHVKELNEESQSSFEIITLDELSFAFAILGFGLACATVVYIFEIIFG